MAYVLPLLLWKVRGLYSYCIHGDYTLTHTRWLREAQLPAGKCWHPRSSRLVPGAHTRLTHSASCPQRNKGDFVSLFKSLGFGYISAPPLYGLLRTDLSSITEALGPDLALGMLRAAQYIAHEGNMGRMAK